MMSVRTRIVLVGMAGLVLVAGSLAESLDGGPGASRAPLLLAQASPPAAAPIVYRPPLRGAPGGRIGGGTRGGATHGSEHQSFVLAAIAPDHTGLTVQEQPSLFWFVSAPTTLRLEFTLNDAAGIRPLLEVQIAPPARPGVQRLRLADYGVRLAPGVRYGWFVAAITDSERRSRDVLAGGTIERVEPPEALGAKLRAASVAQLPAVYADAGLWYDCVGAITDLLDARPDDPALRRQRAALLEQIGLTHVAQYDLTHGP